MHGDAGRVRAEQPERQRLVRLVDDAGVDAPDAVDEEDRLRRWIRRARRDDAPVVRLDEGVDRAGVCRPPLS
jgi:hypothetical protein